jgi:hypothetical protein
MNMDALLGLVFMLAYGLFWGLWWLAVNVIATTGFVLVAGFGLMIVTISRASTRASKQRETMMLQLADITELLTVLARRAADKEEG